MLLLGLLALWLSVGDPFVADGDAAPDGGPADTGLRAVVDRRGDGAELAVTGRVRASRGSSSPVVVRVLGRPDVAAPCPGPRPLPSGRIEPPVGSVRVGWTATRGPRPGEPLPRGRPFATRGTVRVSGDDALRLCVHLVRAGDRPAVLRTVRVVVPSAAGTTPLSVALRPVLGGAAEVLRVALVIAVLLGIGRALWLVVRRMRRPMVPLRRDDHDLPPLPPGVRVPDVPPSGPSIPARADEPVPSPDPGARHAGPGASAQRVGDRRERSWRERRRREVEAGGGVWDPDEPVPSHVTAWADGAEGERLAAERFAALQGLFPSVRILHDRRGSSRARANIDHVFVGPAGVVVVDTKRWRGAVRVVEDRLFVARRDRTRAVEGVLGQVDVVRRALNRAGLPGVPVMGVLHWIETESVRVDGTLRPGGVPIVDASGALEAAVSEAMLDADAVQCCFEALQRELPAAA